MTGLNSVVDSVLGSISIEDLTDSDIRNLTLHLQSLEKVVEYIQEGQDNSGDDSGDGSATGDIKVDIEA